MPPLLSVRGLKKFFPVYSGLFRRVSGYVHAVNGIDFTINQGEVLGMVGESGCGKSTAGRSAIRLIEPTGGSIHYNGQDFLAFTPNQLQQVRKEIQIVFQDPYASLNPRKSIGESIGEALLYHKIVQNRAEQRERVAFILEQVGLSPYVMNRYPHEFSGGQQQRICIGRAIAMQPKLIICDEALSALDVSVQAQIINLLADLKEKMGLSYLFISHDLSLVKYLCDRVVVLYLGKVMEEANTEDLFAAPRHPYTQALLSAIPKRHPKDAKQRMILKGEIPSALHPPSGCPFRTRCPFAQPICAQTPPVRHVKSDTYHCILPPQ